MKVKVMWRKTVYGESTVTIDDAELAEIAEERGVDVNDELIREFLTDRNWARTMPRNNEQVGSETYDVVKVGL